YVVLMLYAELILFYFFFQAEDGIRDRTVTGVQTCALPILTSDTSIPPWLKRSMSRLSVYVLLPPPGVPNPVQNSRKLCSRRLVLSMVAYFLPWLVPTRTSTLSSSRDKRVGSRMAG